MLAGEFGNTCGNRKRHDKGSTCTHNKGHKADAKDRDEQEESEKMVVRESTRNRIRNVPERGTMSKHSKTSDNLCSIFCSDTVQRILPKTL